MDGALQSRAHAPARQPAPPPLCCHTPSLRNMSVSPSTPFLKHCGKRCCWKVLYGTWKRQSEEMKRLFPRQPSAPLELSTGQDKGRRGSEEERGEGWREEGRKEGRKGAQDGRSDKCATYIESVRGARYGRERASFQTVEEKESLEAEKTEDEFRGRRQCVVWGVRVGKASNGNTQTQTKLTLG